MLQRIVLPLLLAAAAHAEGVTIYGDPSGTIYDEVQDAIDAAPSGAVIFLGDGTFEGFVVDGKSLTLTCTRGPLVHVGPSTVRNIPPGGRVLLFSLRFFGESDAEPALAIENCAGDVRVEQAWIYGMHSVTAGLHGGEALRIVQSERVTLADAELRGGGAFPPCPAYGGGDGANALHAIASRVAAYECKFTGGTGAQGEPCGDGGSAARIEGGTFLCYSSFLDGGDGGSVCSGTLQGTGGNGGHGFEIVANADVRRMGGQVFGGLAGHGSTPNLDGTPGSIATGPMVSVLGAPPEFDDPHAQIVMDGTALSGHMHEALGSRIWLGTTTKPAFYLPSSGFFFRHLPFTTHLSTTPTLVQDDLVESVQLPIPDVQASEVSRVQVLQPYVIAVGGTPSWGRPLSFIALDRSVGADCDQNGRPDVFDILLSNEKDVNHDTVPDACQMNATYYVDAAATPGGDGSLANPYSNLADAIERSVGGNTIIVADGTYRGPQNRGLVFGGRSIVLRSANGPATCIIDCEFAGRAFQLTALEDASTRIAGFTIRNGLATDTLFQHGGGGALAVHGAALTLENCVIEDCAVADSTSQHGAAVWAGASVDLRIDGCTFRGFHDGNGVVVGKSWNGGGSNSLVRVVRSRFESTATQPITVTPIVAENRCSFDVVACSFLGTSGASAAAIDFDSVSENSVRVDSSVFAGCVGAPAFRARGDNLQNHYDIEIANSTFVDLDRRALEAYDDATAHVMNSIVWNHTVPNAPTFALFGPGSVLKLDGCDLIGGASGITFRTGQLFFAAGNVAVDPEFVDLDGPDDVLSTWGDNVYRLDATSPCLDAGINLYVPDDWVDLDGDGDLLEDVPFDANGKPRFKDLPSVPDTGIGSPPLVDIGCYERQG